MKITLQRLFDALDAYRIACCFHGAGSWKAQAKRKHAAELADELKAVGYIPYDDGDYVLSADDYMALMERIGDAIASDLVQVGDET